VRRPAGPTLARRDPPRRRHRAVAVGRRRPAVPVGDDARARGRHRLRLAGAGDLHPDGRRRLRGRRLARPGARPGGVSAGRRVGREHGARGVGGAAQGRRGGGAGARRASLGAGGGHDRDRAARRRAGPGRARVPARAGPGGADRRGAGTDRGGRRGRRPGAAVGGPGPGGSGVPGLDLRRDAAWPLVSRAARTRPQAAARDGAVDGADLAVRDPGPAVAGRHGVGAERHDRRRLQRHARLVLGGVRGDDDRPRRRHPGGPARAVLLGGDGGDRTAVPGDSHGVRHRPRGAGRAGHPTARSAPAPRAGRPDRGEAGGGGSPAGPAPGPRMVCLDARKRSAVVTLCVGTLQNCNEARVRHGARRNSRGVAATDGRTVPV
jgi:hypothetical protein